MDNRTKLTQAQAEAKFSGKDFKFKRTNLMARNFVFEYGQQFNLKRCSVEVYGSDGWEFIQLSFRDFLRDQPENI